MNSLLADVLNAAKSAAKTYGRQPSTTNAERLDAAWRTILELDGIVRGSGELGNRQTLKLRGFHARARDFWVRASAYEGCVVFPIRTRPIRRHSP